MRHLWLLTLLALAAVLAAAGQAAMPKAVLKVTYWPHGSEGAPISWTLRCGPIGGSHPARRLACSTLAKHAADLRPASRACMLMPTPTSARAAIKGTWSGTRINRGYRIGCPGWSNLHVVLTGK